MLYEVITNEVEKEHAALYQKALDHMDNMEECDYYICSVCGHTHEKESYNFV